MLLTVTYRGAEPGDLGFLLHKHPERVHDFDLPVGRAHVFYPELEEDRCTAALMLEVDPIELVRSKRFRGDAGTLGHYVNDRPYASGSMLAVALGSVFRTAMTGRCDARPELAASPLELEIGLHAVPLRGGADLPERLFAPLGLSVEQSETLLDGEFPEWGPSPYATITLRGTKLLGEVLRQLYVLLPVLDDAKHYWVADAEVDKLLRAGEGWLAQHPERDLISKRYLVHRREYVAAATARLAELDQGSESMEPEPDGTAGADGGEDANRPLNRVRAEAVLEALDDVGARTVADVGCGPGALLSRLAVDPRFTRIIGTDVSPAALETAARRLDLAERSDAERERIQLHASSVTYQDDRIAGLDAIVLMEVVEHVEPERLDALARSVFGLAAPSTVIVTTPNSEYNALYPTLAAGKFRHPDHRFEWSRAELAGWAGAVADRYGYRVEFRPVGAPDPVLGPPTQLALFRKEAAA
ncbi:MULTISPECIES: 3' terminal RNA ribose 2'-O-methyltransferase Hen1 [unclassified Leifsonia]|uniref:3' terminal RNA ribose 2'-O-methyltransferase Hen1 n=1 Tax=unclassified Leifsonia TaxID=2663824 RepID=UPI0008A7E643|nr:MULTISPECIES: 3' terminal RNA ribose 2'-O-methyltransferase Hen1 [unclassified Leifsonia]SEH66264.1 3' terminal RNA ribose 2'-O-methyltransferase Hen1 [Leifsonia sp. CL154]SFL28016.1 3' terminal RNA ribose 2'-O-methyltransferase Hen1 [Leifsonia sp. CL147]